MKASLAFQQMLKECLAPMLKGYGFSKSGNTFVLNKEMNWGMINFQKSTQSTKDRVKFTITLGIASERLLRFFQIRNKRPQIINSHWNQRLGFYLPEHRDTWWTIESDISTEKLCEELKKHICDLAIPEINEYISDESLKTLWLSGHSPGLTAIQRLMNLSVLLKDLGTQEDLQAVLDELRTASEHKPVASLVSIHIHKLQQ